MPSRHAHGRWSRPALSRGIFSSTKQDSIPTMRGARRPQPIPHQTPPSSFAALPVPPCCRRTLALCPPVTGFSSSPAPQSRYTWIRQPCSRRITDRVRCHPRDMDRKHDLPGAFCRRLSVFAVCAVSEAADLYRPWQLCTSHTARETLDAGTVIFRLQRDACRIYLSPTLRGHRKGALSLEARVPRDRGHQRCTHAFTVPTMTRCG